MQSTASEGETARFSLDVGVPAVVVDKVAKLVCGYHLTIVRPNQSDLNGRYLNYSLKSRRAAHQFSLAANGVTRSGLIYQGTKNVKIFVPPLSDQQQIADFLDWKTGQIDRLIAKKRALVSALSEKRMAVITQAVTRGLDPNVPMKHSGSP